MHQKRFALSLADSLICQAQTPYFGQFREIPAHDGKIASMIKTFARFIRRANLRPVQCVSRFACQIGSKGAQSTAVALAEGMDGIQFAVVVGDSFGEIVRVQARERFFFVQSGKDSNQCVGNVGRGSVSDRESRSRCDFAPQSWSANEPFKEPTPLFFLAWDSRNLLCTERLRQAQSRLQGFPVHTAKNICRPVLSTWFVIFRVFQGMIRKS